MESAGGEFPVSRVSAFPSDGSPSYLTVAKDSKDAQRTANAPPETKRREFRSSQQVAAMVFGKSRE